jgi:hypothetical protein
MSAYFFTTVYGHMQCKDEFEQRIENDASF